jgi:hypothetical protein
MSAKLRMNRFLRNPYFWSACLIGYLITPYILFLSGWLQTVWALCLIALLFMGAGWAHREVKSLLIATDIAHSPNFSVRTLSII